jgi:hypothetical protein
VIFTWFWYQYCCYETAALIRDSRRIQDSGPCLQPFLAVDTGKNDEKGFDLILYTSTGSSWPELPNGREKIGWLHQFPGKLAVHPGVGVAQLSITCSKFLRNPPSCCAARKPPAFEQLEYCWPWNTVVPPVDPIIFGQLRLAAVERAQTEHIITSAGLAQAGKSHPAVRTGQFI